MKEICECGGKIIGAGGTTRLTPNVTRRYGVCGNCGQHWVMHQDKTKVRAKEKYAQIEDAHKQRSIEA